MRGEGGRFGWPLRRGGNYRFSFPRHFDALDLETRYRGPVFLRDAWFRDDPDYFFNEPRVFSGNYQLGAVLETVGNIQEDVQEIKAEVKHIHGDLHRELAVDRRVPRALRNVEDFDNILVGGLLGDWDVQRGLPWVPVVR